MVQHVKGNLRLAPALIQMEKEANALAPTRSKVSDGSFPSAAHTAANPTSDHETGDALDLTHDPPKFDIAERFRLIVARRDRRVKYLIFNGTIWKAYANRGHPAWHPQPYTGPNPHKSHGHVSVVDDYRNDTSLWWPELSEDDDAMNDADKQWIAAQFDAHRKWVRSELGTEQGKSLYDKVRSNLDTVRDGLAKLIRGE